MMGKNIPEWLNSTMWSTPPPSSFNDDGLFRHSPTTEMKDEAESISVSPRLDTATLPSLAFSAPSPSPKLQNGSSNSGASGENGNSVGPSAEDLSRQAHLTAELSKKVINMKELRSLALQGLPDFPGIRSTVWKLLLGYLPPERSLWSTEVKQKRSQYMHYKEEFLKSPSEITSKMVGSKALPNNELKSESGCMLARSRLNDEDHLLSLGEASIWNTSFQDMETIEQIDRDVKRTHPDIPFFSDESSFARSNQESLKNILVVFAKLNPGIRYVQGMNEILAPIFFVFSNDPDEDSASHAEADAFFCFIELLSGFRDFCCQQLDNSSVGIRTAMTKLSELVKKHDEELWRHLEITTKLRQIFIFLSLDPLTLYEFYGLQVSSQFCAFRWITLLLTQDFSFFECLHIWDALLSDPEGPLESLMGICCSMLVLVRRRLIVGDFTSNMKLLQNYPSTNISHLLYVANKLRSKLSD